MITSIEILKTRLFHQNGNGRGARMINECIRDDKEIVVKEEEYGNEKIKQ